MGYLRLGRSHGSTQDWQIEEKELALDRERIIEIESNRIESDQYQYCSFIKWIEINRKFIFIVFRIYR